MRELSEKLKLNLVEVLLRPLLRLFETLHSNLDPRRLAIGFYLITQLGLCDIFHAMLP